MNDQAMGALLMGEQALCSEKRPGGGEARILDAAEELFSRHGFDAVSMQQIAARAGVSKANIFHHFAGKQDLYLAVLERACERIGEVLRSLENAPCANLRPLREFADAHLRFLMDQEDISRLMLREVMDGDSERARMMAVNVFGEHFARLVELIRSGQAEGVLRPDMDAADAAACIVGLNVFIFQTWPVLQHLPYASFRDPLHASDRWLRLLLLGMATPRYGEDRA